MEGFRHDEGHSLPKRINIFAFDDESSEADDGQGLIRWLALAIIVFMLSLAAFAFLVAFCSVK